MKSFYFFKSHDTGAKCIDEGRDREREKGENGMLRTIR